MLDIFDIVLTTTEIFEEKLFRTWHAFSAEFNGNLIFELSDAYFPDILDNLKSFIMLNI